MVINMRYTKKDILVLFTLVVSLLVVWSVPASGAELKGPESKETIIQAKTKDAVAPAVPGQNAQQSFEMTIFTNNERFYILSDTTVIDGKGKMISMDKLPVHCKAKITFQPLSRDIGNALKIEIIAVLKGASTEWYKPDEED